MTLSGRYRVSGTLGRGGMGTVYRGHDTTLDRAVAVKILRRSAPKQVERFLREARAVARVRHTGVVQVYDQGEDAVHGPYVVMELLEGEDLSTTLRRRGRFPVGLALEVGRQACATLQMVHESGVIHRDLKPSNLFLVGGDGDDWVVKIVDFGVAKLAEPDELTSPDEVLGTFAYMAPEQWSRSREATARADVYGLAAVLYEVIRGAPAFRESTLAALRLAVETAVPPPLSSARDDAPAHVVSAIQQALSKSPGDRFASMMEFAIALGVCSPAAARSAQAFRGTDRYPVVRTLARTSGAEIFAARDAKVGDEVALKCVRDAAGETLLRLHREYRVATEIRHPNVVRACDLVRVDSRFCLVLELVRGVPFDEWVQGSAARLHRALTGLFSGLGALHARDFVHGDVKPTNVLVESTGRAVLIDLGLACERGAFAPAGTPAYMPPEGPEQPAQPSRDLYAAGVMIRDALATCSTAGSAAPRELETLSALARDLSCPNAAARPTAEQALARLRETEVDGRQDRRVFVGRKRETDALVESLERSGREGMPERVFIEGPSGIGKTALLEHFAAIARDLHGAIALSGCFREATSIPFPGVEALIDALAEHLASLPTPVVDVLLPRGAVELAQLFPVLCRVPAIVARSGARRSPADPVEVRSVAFDALRELLRRISDRAPVVLAIDDAQWLDTDSAALLTHLLRNPGAPAVLLVATFRDDTRYHSQAFTELMAAAAERRSVVRLSPLDTPECEALIRARLGRREADGAERITSLLERSGGIPFALNTLLEHERAETAQPGLGIADVIGRTIASLSEPSRRILRLLAVASRPMSERLLLSSRDDDAGKATEALVRGRLVRRVRVADEQCLEPYHLGIKSALLDTLTDTERVATHEQLVECLMRAPRRDAEQLIEHLSACGRGEEAGRVASSAADQAYVRLAFDRAAVLYSIAATEPGLGADARLKLARKRAAALQGAGRRHAAGEVLLECARAQEEPGIRRVVEREAARHFLLSGNLTEGFRALEDTLTRLGMRVATDLDEAVLATMQAFQRLSERGLSPEVPGGPLDPDLEERIDVSLVVAQSLTHVDVRGLPFAFEALRAALDGGRPDLVQLASAVFVINTVGHLNHVLGPPALRLCRRLSTQLDDPYARAMLHVAEAEVAHFSADFLSAQTELERAESILLASCVGATRELATVRNNIAFVEYSQKGDFRTLFERTTGWLADADAKQDRYHSCMLRAAHSIVWIARDEPETARAMLKEAEATWPGGAGALEVATVLYYDIIDRYMGDDTAHIHPAQGRSQILHGPAGQTPFLGGYIHLHRAWGALRALARDPSLARERAVAEGALSSLRGCGLEMWSGVADALAANLAYLDGDIEDCILRLESAERAMIRLHMSCLAACARRRRGEVMGREVGARLVRDADDALLALGVRSPSRWACAYWSMFPIDGVALSTRAD